MPESIREKYSSTVFLALPAFLPGSRTAQGKGPFSFAPPSALLPWYYASSDKSSHWATQRSLGVDVSVISPFPLPGAF